MSHAYGQVRFPDGLVLHYEYNGTADVVCTHLYETVQEVSDHWRDGAQAACLCGHHERVEIADDYGYGEWWRGRACRHCRAITAGFGSGVDDDPDAHHGYPEWWVGERWNSAPSGVGRADSVHRTRDPQGAAAQGAPEGREIHGEGQ